MTDFKNVLLSEIHPDPNQPRKFFDDTAMSELTQSIKEKGVLQPILIRPNANGYVLVCGERRYRASNAAGLSDIPAVIRELTDDEALELQIIENLQRKDVHPMEEAVAFKSLMEGKDWSIQEVASRVGKKDFYIRQRLKLNDLVPEWQQLFYKNSFTLTEALQLCLLPVKAQNEFYKNEGDRDEIRIDQYLLNQYKGDLHKATFDLADPTLNRKMGPCTTCQYNTSVSLLFPEHADSPRCMNVPCFKNKTEIFFDREILKAKEDPEVILVSTNGYQFDNKKLVDALVKEGHQVLKGYNDFYEKEQPEKPDWNDYYHEDNSADIDEIKKSFEEDLLDYDKKALEFEKKVSNSKFKKAFVVDGRRPGAYIYIELNKNAADKTTKANVESGDASAIDIDAEITRIKEREKRSKELDAEKVHVQIVLHLKKHSSMNDATIPLDLTDKLLIRFLLHEHVGYSIRDNIKKKLGLKDSPYNASIEEQKRWFASLEFLNDHQVAYMVRKILIDKYSLSLPQQSGGTALRFLAEGYADIPIVELEQAQAIISNKRIERVDKRIAELQAKKKELAAAAKLAKKTKAVKTAS